MGAPTYGASFTIFSANALDSLAGDTNLIAGFESGIITNSAYNDVLLSGRFKANNSAPAAAGLIMVFAYTPINDTPTYPDVLDGTESAETITSIDIRNSILVNVATLNTTTTANRIYEFRQRSLAQHFGGRLPQKWGIWVLHNMSQTLNTTAGNGGQVWGQGLTD